MKKGPYLEGIKASLIDISPVIVELLDVHQRIIWANKAFCVATGLPLKEVEARKCFTIWGGTEPCPGCPVPGTIGNGGEQEAIVSIPARHDSPYGGGAWLIKSTPIKDAGDSVIGVVATLFETSSYTVQIDRYEKTMTSLMRLLKASVDHTSSDLLRMFLDEAEQLTESKIGFYHFVGDDQKTLMLQMWSTNTMRHCTTPAAGTHYLIDQAGVWVDCVRLGEPVIHNDYGSLPHKKGLPDGHVPVIRELVVPVIRGGRLLAILGVGNKETNYDDNDLWIVEQLAAMAWEAIVRKRTEEENKVLQEQFMQSQKLESIGRLAGGVAHDFNNMLSIITGYAELGLEKATSGDPIRDDLQEILSAVERSAEITKQLLAFARRQTISPIPIDLNDAVHGMLKMLRRLIGSNVDLEWKPGPHLWLTKMDPIQTDQLLANLCINARDAIDDVGKIIIETKNVVIDQAYRTEHFKGGEGEYVILKVEDTGCGIDKETCKHIFEPFYTTKKVGEGTGLGLATVYGIAQQNGGFVVVDSEPGEGTTFSVYLVRHQGDNSTDYKKKEYHCFQGKGETVLVVEDEAAILNLTQKILKELGYRVLAAATPKEALQQAVQYGQDISLLITDVVMPEMNGKVLSEKLSADYPNIRSLYMSGYSSDIIALHGVLDRGVHFIQKPVTKVELATKVREVLDN